MRILVISARFPEHGRGNRDARVRGDQTRAFTHIYQLAERHEVTVVTAAVASSRAATQELEEMASVRVCAFPRPRRAVSAALSLVAGKPSQIGWTMPTGAWRVACQEAANSEVALAVTARSVLGPLPCPFVIDHVDALSRNMMYRASGTEPLAVRLFARVEAHLMRRWEERLAGFADAQVATSAEDARVLPAHPPVAVIPNAWRGAVFRDPPAHKRDYDVILSGDMHYPPNREAVTTFIDEILPRVRRQRPATTAIVVGRAAKSLGLQGVAVASDVPDVQDYLRRARVAVIPLMKGPAGTPNKALEAAANGAVLVSPPWALDCFGLPGRRASTVDDFADELVDLLEDEPSRRRLAAETGAVVEQQLTKTIGLRLEALLQEMVNASSRTSITYDSP